MSINYVGEHLLPGKIGQFCVVLAFGTSLFSCLSYFYSTNTFLAQKQGTVPGAPGSLAQSWKRLARISWGVHVAAILGIIISLYTLISSHYFEYHYAWEHSSLALPRHYIISCFWEGQEGSFLLWSFWHIVIGSILVFSAGRVGRAEHLGGAVPSTATGVNTLNVNLTWEAPVMAILCLSQVFICSMLLGVDIGGFQVGSSPFILTRNVMSEAPIFSDPEYLTRFLKDGKGLNPLLQNYWMVIHPPMLFFGFASMIVPFAYAIAGLWIKRVTEWIKPAILWSLIAVMVLGTAIMMGSAWAYEALSFGGFWQWDPVENASLIPWLTLIGAVHVMVSFKSSGNGFPASVILVLVSYLLVLYASFLTRSGILQNASVHAFTDQGMKQQLLLHVIGFLVLAVSMVIWRWKLFPISSKEESTYSREFWMFIGAMVLTLSCIQVIATTSIPVVNALLHTNLAPPVDPVAHYNKWQMLFAILITLISGFSQYLKYTKTNPRTFFIDLGASLFISLLVTAAFAAITKTYTQAVYLVLILACAFSIVSNSKILGDVFKGRIKLAGSAIAHIGFAIMLLGALIAASGRKVISVNTSGTNYGADFTAQNNAENIMLIKGEPFDMGPYRVTYLSDSMSGPDTYYRVNYKRVDPATGQVSENFDLYPNGQINEKMGGLIASPSTRHYLFRDIYTHISSVPTLEDQAKKNSDSSYASKVFKAHLGDSLKISGGSILVEELDKTPAIRNITIDSSKRDLAVGLRLKVRLANGTYTSEPVFLIKNSSIFDLASKIDAAGLRFRFTNIFPSEAAFELKVMERKAANKDYIIMKAMMFPYINFLWGGTIIMIIGFLFSILRRNGDVRRENKAALGSKRGGSSDVGNVSSESPAIINSDPA